MSVPGTQLPELSLAVSVRVFPCSKMGSGTELGQDQTSQAASLNARPIAHPLLRSVKSYTGKPPRKEYNYSIILAI